MTNSSWDPARKLLGDLVKAKRQRNASAALVAEQAALIAEQRLELIASRVRTRLRRLEDFHTYIGAEACLHIDGRLDYRKLDLLVSDLLRRRPELGAPDSNVSPLEYAIT